MRHYIKLDRSGPRAKSFGFGSNNKITEGKQDLTFEAEFLTQEKPRENDTRKSLGSVQLVVLPCKTRELRHWHNGVCTVLAMVKV